MDNQRESVDTSESSVQIIPSLKCKSNIKEVHAKKANSSLY